LTGKHAEVGAATGETASQRREIEAFKAAATAGTQSAWTTFLSEFPMSQFATFAEREVGDAPQIAPSPPPRQTQTASYAKPAEKRGGSAGLIAAMAALFAVGGGGAVYAANNDWFGLLEPVGPKPDDAAAWRMAKRLGTVGAFSSYLEDYANGAYAADAEDALFTLKDEAAWTLADGGDKAKLNKYLSDWPTGLHSVEAREQLNAISLREADAAARAREARLEAERADAAAARAAAARRADDDAWAIAKSADTVSAYRTYLSRYSSGRHAGEARSAINRLERPEPFDVTQLDSSVRNAALKAKEAEKLAEGEAAAARRAASRADSAAARARAGDPGHKVSSTETLRYETEISNGQRNGYGVRYSTSEKYKGDRYRGEWRNGQRQGLAVYDYGERALGENYAGTYVDGSTEGYGVYDWPDAQRYAGGWKGGAYAGYGVIYFLSGSRYEGEVKDNKRHGYGVHWRKDGTISQSGRWEAGKLVQALSK
ncbi:MAG: hypothetical protein AAFQ67_09855, partial [Pseudomonadota bacterium]